MENLTKDFTQKSIYKKWYKEIHLSKIESKWNASTNVAPTSFIYKVRNKLFTNSVIENVNSINTESKYRDRIAYILSKSGKFKFSGMENEIFKLNLQVIDSNMPIIISNMLFNYYAGYAISFIDLLRIVEKENPCYFNLNYNHAFYDHKIKSLLTGIALGMTPATIWQGNYHATAGYIIIKKNGEILHYHISKRNQFEAYLLENTKFAIPSHNQKFGVLYKEGKDIYMNLNLQIKFIN
jgi:hypothetical protein